MTRWGATSTAVCSASSASQPVNVLALNLELDRDFPAKS